MATASRRVKQLRRIKRERTLLHHQVQYQQGQIQTLVGMLAKQRKELTDTQDAIESVLAPEPSYTINTVPGESDGDMLAEGIDLTGLTDLEPGEVIGYHERVELERHITNPNHPEYVTEDLNRDCCIDDSATS